MRHVDHSLLVEISLADVQVALKGWTWLLPSGAEALAVTAGGDVLLRDSCGRVFLLDCGGGSIQHAADSISEFEEKCRAPEQILDWFQAAIVEEMRAAGIALAAGQCYGYTVLPIFAEGSYKSENRYAINALEHIRFTGDVHVQIRDTPDGTAVRIDWQ